MASATVSPRFEITIPEELRDALSLRPGQRVELVQRGERIELIPTASPASIEEARGFLKGISTTIERKPDRL